MAEAAALYDGEVRFVDRMLQRLWRAIEAGGRDTVLLVTSDRLSAFDVIMNEGIPKKGQVLNQISIFWFKRMADIIPNHIVATEVSDFPAATHAYRDQLEGRSMLVKKDRPLPLECTVWV